MKLVIREGELMLPEDFSFEIQRNNPFFSDDGSATVPVTIPATDEMRAKLGFPDRLNRAYRFKKKRPAVLMHRSFNKHCSLVIDSFADKSGITASLAFEESQMYAELQDRSLKDIFKNEKYTFTGASTPTAISHELFQMWYNPLSPSMGFVVFPVAVEKQEDGSVFILNDVGTSTIHPTNFICSARTITIGSSSEDVPEGYGVTPFLTLSHFLEKTFSLCGYNLVRNDLATAPFDRLTILNNCADTLCGQNGVNYRDLVPSITFGELLVWLKDKFCASVFISNKNVSIILFETAMRETPDLDLTKYTKDGLSVNYPDPQSVSLKQGSSIDGAEPAFEDINEIKSTIGVETHDVIEDANVELGIYFVPATGQFYNRRRTSADMMGSNCIPYRYDGELAENTFDASDEFVPQVRIASDRLPNNQQHIPYLGDRLHNHTGIKSKVENGEREDSVQNLMLCHSFVSGQMRMCGNSQPFENTGNSPISYNAGDRYHWISRQYPALTPYGIYPYCWVKYNEMLMNSSPTVEIEIDLPVSLIFSTNLALPKLFKGRRVLISSYTIEMSNDTLKVAKMTLQQLPAYRDAVEDNSVGYVPDGYRLTWQLVQTPAPNPDYTYNDAPYTASDAPSYAPLFKGQIAKYRFIHDTYFPPRGDLYEYFVAILQKIS